MDEEHSHECEDGELCICEVSTTLRPQKRKCEGQELAETKRRRSQKLTGSDDLGTTGFTKSDKQISKANVVADKKKSSADDWTETVCVTYTEAAVQQLRTDDPCMQEKSDIDLHDFNGTPEVERTISENIRWKEDRRSAVVEILSIRNGEPAIEEMHKLSNVRLGSDNADEIDQSNIVHNNTCADKQDNETCVGKEQENCGALTSEIDSTSQEQNKIVRRRSLRNLKNVKAENTPAEEKIHEHCKKLSENKNEVSSKVRNKKKNFSSRLKESLSALDDGVCNEVQNDKCIDANHENLVKHSVDSNHSGKTTKTDKRSKLSNKSNSIRLKSKAKTACSKQSQELSKKRTKSVNKCVKSRTYKSRSCERTGSEASGGVLETQSSTEDGKLHLKNLKDQVQQARSTRNNAKRLTQSLTENKESKDLDKFEKLKMSISDLDSLGYGGLSEKFSDIDSFISALNDIDNKLTESAMAASKPFKLKTSLQDSRRKKDFTKIHNSTKCSKTSKSNSNQASVKISIANRCACKVSKKNLITSTPKLQTGKGRRTKKSKSKISVCESRTHLDDINNKVKPDSDTLDFSLPTPRVEDTSCLPCAGSNSNSVSFDSNVAKDMCDSEESDEELPVGLTPIKIEKTFQEKDIVWVKWKPWPYLPAMVKKVYKKKKRVTCLIFRQPDKQEKPLSLSTVGNRVWSYFDSDKKEEILKASEHLEPNMKTLFKECIANVDDFLTKKALGQIEDDLSFFNQDDFSGEEMMDSEGDEILTEDSSQQIETDTAETEDNNSVIITSITGPHGLSKKGEIRKEKVREKTQKLTDFLQSAACKEYLQGLFLEKTKSERHTTFVNGTVKEKYGLKHQGYGPIDDESQIMTLLMTYYEWLQEVNKSPYLNVNDYIMDVWVPEAIVFAYQKYFTYSKKKAWEMFFKGPRRTKEELQQMHDMIIEQANNMSPEDRQRFREREEEILRAAGIDPDYKPKKLVI